MVTELGNDILRSVGLVAPKSTQHAGVGLVDGMRNLNREEEYYLGRAVAARLLAHFEETQNAELQTYLARVGQVVARESVRPDTFGGYHFSVLKSEAVNAYAAPGGFVFVTEGLLKLLPDEDALASVLSHEVAHVALRHGEKSISEKNMNDSVMALGQLAGSLSCADIVQQASVIFGAAVDDVVGQLLEKGYSREQEAEADLAGFKALIQSGYRRESAFEVFALLRTGSSDNEGGWFSSHPDVEERAEKLVSVQSDSEKNASAGFEIRKLRYLRLTRKALS